MVNQQLVDYIKSCKEKGFDVNSVRGHLIKNNFNVNDIDEAIHFVDFAYPDKKQEIKSIKQDVSVKQEFKTDVKRPTGITVVGWFYIITGVLGVISSIFMLLFGNSLSFLTQGLIKNYLTMVMGILIVYDLLWTFIGYELLRLKNWARIVAIIMSILTILSIISAIFLYILLRKDTKEAFKRA